MTVFAGYTESQAKIKARWQRWMKRAEEANKQAEQSAQQNNSLIRAVAVSEG